MEKIIQRKGESRKDYLLRVALWYIDEEAVHVFDEAECDGACLIDDIKAELNID